jgi:steroid 5-alpha reductase family enzyme
MSVVILIILLGIGLAVAMAMAWQVVLRTGQSGYVDTFWSYSIGVAGVIAALVPLDDSGPQERNWLVAALVAVWSLRLGTHILQRTLKGGDDPRYAQLKSEWGADYKRQLLIFLQIQAACGLVLAVAVMAAAHNPAPLGLPDLLGILIAIVAIAGESIADAQLAAFRKDPANKGKVCDVGLWGLSRHPNYFFEWLYWLAYPLIAIGYGFGWAALSAPILMYWLLVHASGIPPLEAHMMRSRPEAFAAYKKRVSAFWPIPKTR